MREPAHQTRSEPPWLGLGSGALDAGWLALPFAGTPGGAGAVHVPPMDARQYVALRALEEQWWHPARRAELETAPADFAVMLRGQVLR